MLWMDNNLLLSCYLRHVFFKMAASWRYLTLSIVGWATLTDRSVVTAS